MTMLPVSSLTFFRRFDRLAVVTLAVTCSPLLGHDMWIEPTTFSPEPGQIIGLKLRVGQDVVLHVETAQAAGVLAIPESAIVEEGDLLIAFVQISGETFEKREIKAGVRDTAFVQVLDGIQEGERVVTKGAYAIRLSTLTGVIPAHGHAH